MKSANDKTVYVPGIHIFIVLLI